MASAAVPAAMRVDGVRMAGSGVRTVLAVAPRRGRRAVVTVLRRRKVPRIRRGAGSYPLPGSGSCIPRAPRHRDARRTVTASSMSW